MYFPPVFVVREEVFVGEVGRGVVRGRRGGQGDGMDGAVEGVVAVA